MPRRNGVFKDVLLRRNYSKGTAACFKVATKFRMLYSIMLNKKNRSVRMFLLCRGLSKFLAASTTMEAQPLKNWILDSRSQQDVVQE